MVRARSPRLPAIELGAQRDIVAHRQPPDHHAVVHARGTPAVDTNRAALPSPYLRPPLSVGQDAQAATAERDPVAALGDAYRDQRQAIFGPGELVRVHDAELVSPRQLVGADAVRLRQSSPFAGVLTPAERRKVYDTFGA